MNSTEIFQLTVQGFFDQFSIDIDIFPLLINFGITGKRVMELRQVVFEREQERRLEIDLPKKV